MATINKHTNLYEQEEVSQLEMEMLADFNRYDVMLYEAVRDLFEVRSPLS